MKIITTDFFNKSLSEYGDFEVEIDSGWSILDSIIDFESGLLVITTQNDNKNTWKNLGGGARGILTRQYIIDKSAKKILSAVEWRKYFDYDSKITISANNEWKMISQRIYNIERDTDLYDEKIYEISSNQLIAQSTSLAFRDKERETLLAQHIRQTIEKPQIEAEAAARRAQEPIQYCGCCNKEVNYMPRYPKYICSDCYKLPKTDKQGQLIEFGNTSMFGGFTVYYIDEAGKILSQDDSHSSFMCQINGRTYFAEEGKFGGIVIQ
jgi:hypothetical protein